MKSLKKHYIVPLNRGGDAVNENTVYWPPSIKQAWDLFFGNMTPEECKYFISLISLPGVYVNHLRINQLRRQAVSMALEDLQRDRGHIISKRAWNHHLKAVNPLSDPPIEREVIEFTRHHILPRTRDGTDESRNLTFWMEFFHAAYHTIFSNLKVDEVTECIRLMTLSNGESPFRHYHKGIEFIRNQSKEWSCVRKKEKPRLRFG